jgi:hypothetical protein
MPNDPTAGIQKGLVLAADHFRNKMEAKERQNNLPKAISDATSIGTPVQSGGQAYIDITISLNQAPMAAAFEYGSGLHSEKGDRKKYLILPKNADVLAFPWGEAENLNPSVIGVGNVEIVNQKAFLPMVRHPGVQARPYIRPTIQDERKEIRRILGKEFVASISLGGTVTIIQ